MLRNLNQSASGKRILGVPQAGILAAQIASETAEGDHGPGILYNESQDAGYAGKYLRAAVTNWPSTGTLFVYENGNFDAVGLANGAHVFGYDLYVNGVYDSASTFSITIGAIDASPPGVSLTGSSSFSPGVAVGGYSAEAVGAVLSGTTAFAPGAAAVAAQGTATGATLVGSASFSAGAAIATDQGTALGAVLVGAASFSAGAATATGQEAAAGAGVARPPESRWAVRPTESRWATRPN